MDSSVCSHQHSHHDYALDLGFARLFRELWVWSKDKLGCSNTSISSCSSTHAVVTTGAEATAASGTVAATRSCANSTTCSSSGRRHRQLGQLIADVGAFSRLKIGCDGRLGHDL